MRIYLDNCVFNRPFDDQNHLRVRLETEAKLYIQAKIQRGCLALVWSYILEYENAQNPFDERKRAIAQWKNMASVLVPQSSGLLLIANEFLASGTKPKDALHVASAIMAQADCFLSTDDSAWQTSQAIPDPGRESGDSLETSMNTITDSELRRRGIETLIASLGEVQAERFISLILREPFDYTQWQRSLWPDKSLEELSELAMEHWNQPAQ